MNNLYKVSLKAKKCKLLVIILKKALAYAILFNEIFIELSYLRWNIQKIMRVFFENK